MSRDFLRYRSGGGAALDADWGATLLAASAWNDHGFVDMVLPDGAYDYGEGEGDGDGSGTAKRTRPVAAAAAAKTAVAAERRRRWTGWACTARSTFRGSAGFARGGCGRRSCAARGPTSSGTSGCGRPPWPRAGTPWCPRRRGRTIRGGAAPPCTSWTSTSGSPRWSSSVTTPPPRPRPRPAFGGGVSLRQRVRAGRIFRRCCGRRYAAR